MNLGVVCKPTSIPDWPLVEIQFEKSVTMKPADARNLRSPSQVINVHAPYYGTMASGKRQKTRDTMYRILEAAQIGHALGSEIIVTHAGFYSKNSPEEAYKIVRKNYEEVLNRVGLLKIGIETMPRPAQFGSASEVMRLAQDIGITPVFNLDSMQRGGAKEEEIIALVNSCDNAYCHFKDMKWKEKVDATLVYEGSLDSLKGE